jgi:hypothetical protein
MRRVRAILAPFALALFLQPPSVSQTTQPAKPSPKPRPDSCDSVKQKSFADGWKQGADSSKKESWSEGFSKAMELTQMIYSVQVGDSPKQQKISIVVEDIDGSTAYEFAAAEIIRTYFADSWTTVTGSSLTLHISGTKLMALSYGADVQSVHVEVTVPASQTLVVGDEKRLIYGSLQLASEGGTMKGYSQQEKAQAVREYIYKALSEYKGKWEKAAPKTTQQSGGAD